jgi:curved DNA-binding protein
MAIEYKDYYGILGVSRSAGDEEIRNAFRRQARIYHPDKTGNDQAAEDRFKEINEAYEVLGDAQRRRHYDDFTGAWESSPGSDEAWRNFSRAGHFGEGSNGPRGREHFRFDGAGFSEFFEELFGRRQGNPRAKSQNNRQRESAEEVASGRGDDLESDVWVTLDEVANGAVRPITMKRAMKCATCCGMGQYNAHPCEACDGNGSVVRSETWKVKIPKGIKEGAFLRVTGRGEQGVANGPPGDLYLKVHYSAHPDFRVEHGTLVHDLELAPWEAVLGATVSVPTLDGKATIKVPAGTRSGAKLRLKAKGVAGDTGPGDLILNIKVQVPGSTAVKERALWEELARESAFHPRDN